MINDSWKRVLESYSSQAVTILRHQDREIDSVFEISALSRGSALYPPADEGSITRCEERLGAGLPTHLRDFYRFTNGLCVIGFDAEANLLLPIEKVNFLSVVEPESSHVLEETAADFFNEPKEKEDSSAIRRLVALTPYADSGLYLLDTMAGARGRPEIVSVFFRGDWCRFATIFELIEVESRKWLRNLNGQIAPSS